MKFYKVSVLIVFFIIGVVKTYAFKLQNISFNQRVDTAEGGYREFYIINDYLAKQRYKVNILPGNKKNGAKFVEVYPKVITVDPLTRGVVKVFMKVPQSFEKGEYNFKLQFQPINIPTLAKNKEGITSGTSNINIAPIISLKGYVGEVNFDEALKLNDIKVKKNNDKGIVVSGELSNNSYAAIDFGVEAYGSNNFLYGSEHIGELEGNTKAKKVKLLFPMIKNPDDLKKLIFYRTPSNTKEIVKEIIIKK